MSGCHCAAEYDGCNEHESCYKGDTPQPDSTRAEYGREDALRDLEAMMGDYHNDEPVRLRAYIERTATPTPREDAVEEALERIAECWDEDSFANRYDHSADLATLRDTITSLRSIEEAVDNEYGLSPRMWADIRDLYGAAPEIAVRLDEWVIGIETALTQARKEVE